MSKFILYKSFRVALYKIPLEKNTKYWRNKTVIKIAHHAFAKSSHWVKIRIQKNTSKSLASTSNLKLFCAKNRLKKASNTGEMR